MKRVRNVAIGLLSLALVVVLFDWTVAAFGPFGIGGLEDMRRLRASSDGARHQAGVDEWYQRGVFQLRTDDNGARIGTSARPAVEGAKHVVVVGDGATLGWGVDASTTFAARFERLWNEAGLKPSIQIHNLAHVGFRLRDADWSALPLKPDAVVVCGPTVAEGLEPSLADALSGADGGQAGFLPAMADVNRRLADRETVPSVDKVQAASALAAFAEAGRGAGAKLVFVELGEGSVGQIGQDLGVPVAVGQFDERELRSPVFADPRHGYPNALGHQLIAERLFEGLRGRLF